MTMEASSESTVSARQIRNRLLVRVLEQTGGQMNVSVDLLALGQEEGFNWHQVHAAWCYMLDQHWCRGMGTGMIVGITSSGVDEAEAILDHGEGKRSALPFVQNIFNVSHSSVGAMQVGDRTTANVQQRAGSASADELAEHFELLERALAELEGDGREEASELVTELRQLTSADPAPKKALLKAVAESLGRQLPIWVHESLAFVVSHILARMP